MRRALLALFLVTTACCRKESPTLGQGGSTASAQPAPAQASAMPMPLATSREAEKLRAPTRSDAKLALFEAGYRGGSQSTQVGKPNFSLDDVPGPEGRIANVRVYARNPPSPGLDADYRARGGVPLFREEGLVLAVFVEKNHKPDPTATADLLEKVSASAGKTIPTVIVTPSFVPSWKIKDMLEAKFVETMLGGAKYEAIEASAETPTDKVGNEYGRSAVGKGKRGEDRISLHLECERPGSSAASFSPVHEDAGGAMFVDGSCVAMVHVTRGSNEIADSEASQRALLELLQVTVWRWPL